MKKTGVILLLVFCFFSHFSFSQFALNGTVKIVPYQGVQADIIEGVSALPAVNKPVVRHVCLVNKNCIALTIDEQAVIYQSLIPYIKQSGDTVLMKSYHGQSKVVKRKGEEIGYLCGVKENWLRLFNTMAGEKLDVEWISNPANFTIISDEDNKSVNPLKIFRKTYPNRRTHVAQNNELAVVHEIFLELPDSLKNGMKYHINFRAGNLSTNRLSFVFNENLLRSEAIHINLAGYEPEDPKVAFLSMWMGDGGSLEYEPGQVFRIINRENKIVYEGKSELKQAANKNEFSIGETGYNHNLADVHSLDFSDLKSTGAYRLVVPGIGCSFEFEIRDGIWEDFTRLNMKGFLHQRSGIELGPPFTNYLRPRNMHPDDEVSIHKCDVTKFFENDAGGQQGVFKRIQNSILLDTNVSEAWGSWMDAGDFDRRMSHLYSVRRMMYLYEMNPVYFENLDLGIPESNNNIPDILDEARWGLDLYKRTQGVYEEGGVSWWVESIEHPRGGETSWLNSLPTALVPPTPTACFTYATCAAQMSVTLKKYNSNMADEYLKSAQAAMKWAGKNQDAPDVFARNSSETEKAMAYVAIYRASGDENWLMKLENILPTVFPKGIVKSISTENAEVLWNYLLISDQKLNRKTKEDAKLALTNLADELLAGAEENTFSIFRTKNQPIVRMVLPARTILPVAAAHFISKEKKYADALCKTIQYTMGANPMNRSYVSGLGERWFIPYSIDFDVTDEPAPSGIPNFGPITQTEDRWGWTGKWAIDMVEEQGLYPHNLLDWPFAEKCFNNCWIAPVNEFTVRHPMGELIMLTGYLAQNGNVLKHKN